MCGGSGAGTACMRRARQTDMHGIDAGSAAMMDTAHDHDAEAIHAAGRHAHIDAINTRAQILLDDDPAQASELAWQAFELASGEKTGESPYPRGMADGLTLLADCNRIEGLCEIALGQAAEALQIYDRLGVTDHWRVKVLSVIEACQRTQ